MTSGGPRILIRGGTLVDGSGCPPRRADVLIEEERVTGLILPGTAVRNSAQADRIIEAAGFIVCPGFIDIHSHGDLIFALPPDAQRDLMEGRIGQGITTEIVGNCGLGVFPCDETSEPAVRGVVGWMTPPLEQGAPAETRRWPWADLESYLAHLESNGVWVNVGALQPHGPLRIQAAGLAGQLEGAQAKQALATMSWNLEASLDAGAFGLSTGLIYPPGIFTPTEEILDLARALARRCADGAFVASHIRGSSETLLPAVEELLEVGRAAGVRVQHSHSEAVGRDHWHKIDQVLDREERARRSGVDVAYDMFPYTAAATMMLAIYPPWALEGGVDRLLARLADPSARAAIDEAIRTITPSWPPWTKGGWPHNLVKAVGWDHIRIGSVASAANRHLEGMTLAQLGCREGKSPLDAISDLMIQERGMVSQIIHGISGEEMHEAGIETLLRHEAGAVCTDANDFGKGKPHPAAYGAFPRVLGQYVRERRLLSLEAAIRKMTGYPASLLKLSDRGVVRAGAFADLVVLDPETIGSQATFDAPRSVASGIAWVLVNGAVVISPGNRRESSLPSGRVLRRQG